MILVCTRCRAHVASGDLNPSTKIARCTACSHAFDARARLSTVATPAAPSHLVTARRAAIDVIEVPAAEGRQAGYRGAARRGGELEVRHKWAPAEIMSIVAIGFFWNGVRFASNLEGLPTVQAILLVVGVAGAAFFGYCAAALHFNKTVVRATPRGVTVRHEPLPWPGNRAVAAHDLKRLACEAVAPKRPLRRSQTFTLTALLRDGRKVGLLTGLPDRDQALAIERRLEQHLDLSGVRVAGATAGAARTPRAAGGVGGPSGGRALRERNDASDVGVGDELDESSGVPAAVGPAGRRARDV